MACSKSLQVSTLPISLSLSHHAFLQVTSTGEEGERHPLEAAGEAEGPPLTPQHHDVCPQRQEDLPPADADKGVGRATGEAQAGQREQGRGQ